MLCFVFLNQKFSNTEICASFVQKSHASVKTQQSAKAHEQQKELPQCTIKATTWNVGYIFIDFIDKIADMLYNILCCKQRAWWYGPLAQWLEQSAHNRSVRGSSP